MRRTSIAQTVFCLSLCVIGGCVSGPPDREIPSTRELHTTSSVDWGLRGPVKGTMYFVNIADPRASDDNDGCSSTSDSRTGRGPWKTIQKAASSMSAGDATVVLPGMYKESDVRFDQSGTADAPIQLHAGGYPGEVVLDGDGRPQSIGIHLTDGRSHIVLSGFTIQNMSLAGIASDQGSAAPYTNISVRNVRLRQNGDGLVLSRVERFSLQSVHAHRNEGDGIRLHSSSDGSLIACQAYDNGRIGARVLSADTLTIDRSAFYGNGDTGLQLGEEGTEDHACRKVNIKSCISHNNGVDGFALFSGCRENVVAGNQAYKNRRLGFLLAACTRNELRDNTAFGNTEDGFVLLRSSHNKLSGNRSHHHGVNGFAVIEGSSHNTVFNNESHSNGMRGFLVTARASSNTFRANDAHDNTILGFGVYDQSRDNVFDRNRIHHNVYHGVALLHDAHENTFVGNTIHHNSACGIYFEASRDNRFEKNVLHHNRLDGFAVLYESTGNEF